MWGGVFRNLLWDAMLLGMGIVARKAKNLALVSSEQQRRIRATQRAAREVRKLAHAQLDTHLDQIMPELLADISVGMGFTVGIRTLPPPDAESLDPNAEAVLAQRTGVLNEKGEEVRRIGLAP
jgi:hypothetical protein